MLSHEEFRKTRRKLPLKKGTSSSITINEIINFENKHKINLPIDYKDFLLNNNGIEPVINTVEINLNNTDEGEFCILFFVELENIEFGGSDEQLDESTFHIKPPKGFINIAHIDGDHPELFICVKNDKNYGEIFYCEDRDPQMLQIIRKNFNELINTTLPYNEFEFEDYCDSGDDENAKNLVKKNYEYPEDHYNSLIEDALKSNFDMTETIKELIKKENNIDKLKELFFKVPKKIEIIEIFFNKSININQVNSLGNNLLMESIYFEKYVIKDDEFNNKLDFITYLLKKGINTSIKNNKGLNIFEVINSIKTDPKFKAYYKRNEIYDKIESHIKEFK